MALFAALVTLCACSGGGAVVGKLPESFGGLPASAPAHPAETMPYPNVYEPRPTREATPLTAEEQKRLESELSNLRDAQNKRANPPPPEPKSATKTVAKSASKAPAREAKEQPKEQAKRPAKERAKKKVADQPKPKPAEKKKPADTLVPEPKAPSDLKLMN